jgi:drug/metabolite transporter (DMT)-like permease
VALTELSAAEATIILATEPLWGAAFAYVALGEQLSPVALLGGAIVVASCVWSSLGRNAPDAPEDEDLAAERP